MNNAVTLAIALGAIPLAVALFDVLWRQPRMHSVWTWWKSESMPYELRRSTLVMNEKLKSTQHPVPLNGRVDQVFRTPRGKLIIVDTKRRTIRKVFFSDIIQMSVYRVILIANGERSVAPYGYVRIVVPSGAKRRISYQKVRLLNPLAVVKLWHTYHELRSGKRRAICSCDGTFH